MKNATVRRFINPSPYFVDDFPRLAQPLVLDEVGDRTGRRLKEGLALSFVVQDRLAIRVCCCVSHDVAGV
jgi:hypothetical protein